MPIAGPSVEMDGTLREVEGGFDAFICHGKRSKVGRVHVLWRRGGSRTGTGTLEVRVRRPPGSRWFKTPVEDPHLHSTHGMICLSAISADCSTRLVPRSLLYLQVYTKGDEIEGVFLFRFPLRSSRTTWNGLGAYSERVVYLIPGVRGGGRSLPCLLMPPLAPRFPFTACGNPGRHQRNPRCHPGHALFTLRSGQLQPDSHSPFAVRCAVGCVWQVE